jgi:hypothetical protein
VDAGKNPYLGKLGITKDTQDIATMLVRRGVSHKEISFFLTQPVIQKYLEYRAINESDVIKKTGRRKLNKDGENTGGLELSNADVAAKTLEFFGVKDKLEKDRMGNILTEIYLKNASQHSLDDLKKGLSIYKDNFNLENNPKLSDAEKQYQFRILMEFLNYLSQTRKFNEFINIANPDTNADKNLSEALETITETQAALKSPDRFIENTADWEQEDIFGGILKPYYEAQKIREAFKDVDLVYSNPLIRLFIPKLTKLLYPINKKEHKKTKEKVVKTIADDIILRFIMKNIKANTNVLSLISGDNTVAKRLEAIKVNPNHPLHNNKVIDKLVPLVANTKIGDKTYDNFQLYEKKMQSYAINLLTDELIKIRDVDRKLFSDIIVANFLQGGLGNSPFQLNQIIPAETYYGAISKMLDKFDVDMDDLNIFAKEYILNRPNLIQYGDPVEQWGNPEVYRFKDKDGNTTVYIKGEGSFEPKGNGYNVLNYGTEKQTKINLFGESLEEQEVIKQPIDNKEGIDFVFEQSPELAKIGSKEQYSQYLDTVFPDSKVKQVVYRGDLDFKLKEVKGISFWTNEIENAISYNIERSPENEAGFVTHAVINLKNPFIHKEDVNSRFATTTPKDLIDNAKRQNADSAIWQDVEDIGGRETQFVVFEPEQIHILGSKQDIEGFKQFINNKQFQKPSPDKQNQYAANEQTKLKKQNLFTVKPIQTADKKAIIKASIANKYIGFGENIPNSSTELYRQQIKKQEKSTIDFQVENSGSTMREMYLNRTAKNASADTTLDFGLNQEGESWTKNAVIKNNKKYIGINTNNLTVTDEVVNKIVEQLNNVNAKSLNIAGMGIYNMKSVTQEQVDDYVYKLLNAVINSPRLKTKIESIRTGGQTGFDEAGAKAGQKLGIKTLILAPKGFTFRNKYGKDISDEEQFKDRFKKKLVNSGNYSSDDVIFVSIVGKRGNETIRKEQQDKTIKEALKAIEAGATLITDNIKYIHTDDKGKVYDFNMSVEEYSKTEGLYNEGEKRLAKTLEAKGYSYSEQTVDGQILGVWNKNSNKQFQLLSSTEQNQHIATEQTIRDLAARMSARIGIPFRFESDRTKKYKGYIENGEAVINLAYATLDTPVHEIFGHSIIKVIKDKNPELYNKLLKELEKGKGLEVFNRVKRDYSELTLEQQQEESIVELLSLYTADKLDKVKDRNLISLLKQLLKEMTAYMRSLFNSKEIDISKLDSSMTLDDLANLLAYSNSKIILPGSKVEYQTPDGSKFSTYQEANNHISKLFLQSRTKEELEQDRQRELEALDKLFNKNNYYKANENRISKVIPVTGTIQDFKKAVGLTKKEINTANRGKINKEVEKYNAKNGTSYYVVYKQVGQSTLDTYEILNKSKLDRDFDSDSLADDLNLDKDCK